VLLATGGTKNVNAHDLFLKGRELMFGNKLDREAFEQSISCFRRAVELDPNYAAAYAGLAMGHSLDYQNHWSDTPDKSLAQAQRLVDDAIAKDEKESFAHFVACVVATWTKDYERCGREAERALELNPNYALAHLTKGNLHTYTGEPDKAIACYEQAFVSTRRWRFIGISSAPPISSRATMKPPRPRSRNGSRWRRHRICHAPFSPAHWVI
jgi:adenylate cyclase